jgi:hypothetical protein
MSPIPNTLPTPNRYITTHTPSTGAAILSTALPAPAKWQHLKGDQASFFLAYCTDTSPVDLSTPSLPGAPPQDANPSHDAAVTNDESSPVTNNKASPAPKDPSAPLPHDVSTYASYLSSPPGLTLSSGTVLRYVDMAPPHTSPTHRTVSPDYGVVIEGEVELVLDSGETTLLKRGDTAVQRATAHAWRNTSATRWARMLFVLVPCAGFEVAGRSWVGWMGLGGVID